MAGITANSVSVSMLGGDTDLDQTKDGYIASEQVALATNPTGSTYAWNLAKPSGATVRSDLSATTGPGPVFTPDSAGFYTITVVVDSTITYVLRISVTFSAATTLVEALRMPPQSAGTVTAPASGYALFVSNDTPPRLKKKDSSAVVTDIDPGSRTGTFTLLAGTATILDASVTANTTVVANCTAATDRGTLTYTFVPGASVAIVSSDGSDASVYKFSLQG